MSLSEGSLLSSSKAIAFVAIMGALGSLLAILSTYFVIGPNTALDFSHIGTYIVAIGGGPILGAICGAIVGIVPAFRFSNVALIPGKILTGFTVGFLYYSLKKMEFFKKNRKTETLAIVIAGLVGYIPEMVFTIADLHIIGLEFILPFVIPKAWLEIVILTALMAVLFNYDVIKNFIYDLVGARNKVGLIEYLVSGIVFLGTFIFTIIVMLLTGYFTVPANYTLFFNTMLVCIGILVALFIIVFYIHYRNKSPIEK
jgi:hypothetical protein